MTKLAHPCNFPLPNFPGNLSPRENHGVSKVTHETEQAQREPGNKSRIMTYSLKWCSAYSGHVKTSSLDTLVAKGLYMVWILCTHMIGL